MSHDDAPYDTTLPTPPWWFWLVGAPILAGFFWFSFEWVVALVYLPVWLVIQVVKALTA